MWRLLTHHHHQRLRGDQGNGDEIAQGVIGHALVQAWVDGQVGRLPHAQGETIWLGLGVLPVVALYPFVKRFSYWPQAVLGLAFNWGALVGWAAVRGTVELVIMTRRQFDEALRRNSV